MEQPFNTFDQIGLLRTPTTCKGKRSPDNAYQVSYGVIRGLMTNFLFRHDHKVQVLLFKTIPREVTVLHVKNITSADDITYPKTLPTSQLDLSLCILYIIWSNCYNDWNSTIAMIRRPDRK